MYEGGRWMEEGKDDEYLKGGEDCLMREFSRIGLERQWRNGDRFSLYLWRWCWRCWGGVYVGGIRFKGEEQIPSFFSSFSRHFLFPFYGRMYNTYILSSFGTF